MHQRFVLRTFLSVGTASIALIAAQAAAQVSVPTEENPPAAAAEAIAEAQNPTAPPPPSEDIVVTG
ncbi:MAG: hypothetical protein VYB32_05785, partial [Pseudomonadota bacterium]|nr:hypothetical protein [Pseudomonadota bacterium]